MPSRNKKTRTGASGAAAQPQVGQPPAIPSSAGQYRPAQYGVGQSPAVQSSPAQVSGVQVGGAQVAEPGQQGDQRLTLASAGAMAPSRADGSVYGVPRRSSIRRLRNWRVRSRLVLLIAIPTATAVALGGASIVNSWQSAISYQRIERLASLAAQITGLANALEYERDSTVTYIAGGSSGRSGVLHGLLKLNPSNVPTTTANEIQTAQNSLLVIHQASALTDRGATAVQAGLAGLGSGLTPVVTQDATAVSTKVKDLSSIRTAALSSNRPAVEVIGDYAAVINVLLAFDEQIALTSGDQELNRTVRAMNEVSAIEQEYSTQRAIVMYALTKGQFAPRMFSALTASIANLQADRNLFQTFASSAQLTDFNTTVQSGSLQTPVNQDESKVIANASNVQAAGVVADDWRGSVTTTIGTVRSVETRLVSESVARAVQLRNSAILSAALIGAAVLLVLVLSLVFTVFVGRSMVRPLRRLRAGALEVAGIRLPEMVRRMSEADGENISLEIDPIEVASADEIGEVARAFDQVHREALRLAANEAALRGNVNAMFVNLSRRSQSLVERQIRLIDSLEQGEQDPERLASLFQMDHLATRMRRNSENLLVLAGHESSRRWNQPVALVDVLRAAISEIEQYERVTLNVQPGISVRGPGVNDVVHLIAELAENATSFSSADTPVSVSGHLLSSGGVLLDITDQGVGMGSDEMAHANWRLDNPPVVDVAVSRRMGLFVVARLAARHGIRVRLRSAPDSGLTALVWLPDEVVVKESGRVSAPGWLPEQLVARPAIEPGGPGWAGEGDRVAIGGGDWSGAGGGWSAPGDWSQPERSQTEKEVAAARAPSFAGEQSAASASADAGGGNGSLGPQRVPGVGPRPGRGGATTGPIPTVGAGEPSEWSQRPETATAGWSSSGADWSSPAWTDEHTQPGASAWAGDSAARSVLGAPTSATRDASGTFRTQGIGNGPADGEVIVPPAVSLGEENRLPIFEAVESDWFRRGRPIVGSGQGDGAESFSWASPGDEGWRIAETAAAPSSSGTTLAGLPRRVPQANLVPGSVGDVASSAPMRSAAVTRDRFASLQRGIREGRAAGAAERGVGSDGDAASQSNGADGTDVSGDG